MEKNKKWKILSGILLVVLIVLSVFMVKKFMELPPILEDQKKMQTQITELQQKRDELKEKVMLAQLPKHDD